MTRKRLGNALTAVSLVAGLLLLTQVAGHSYVSSGRWDAGDIPVRIHLGNLSTAWRNAAIDGLRAWNAAGSRFLFSWSSTSRAPADCERYDATNSVIWSDTQCSLGRRLAWDDNLLAKTHFWTDPSTGAIVDADVMFNNTKRWSIYNGRLRRSSGDTVWDFRRVATHEFGHVLGLDHPDDHGQVRTALMNSQTSDIDTLQADDVNGIRNIYGSDPGRGSPDLVVRSVRVNDSTLTPGQVFSLSATIANEGAGTSAATTLRYHYWRASAREWTVIGFDSVTSLAPSASAGELIRLRAPSTAGRHTYTACVQAVVGETNRRNCASSSVRVTVSDGGGGAGAPDLAVRNARLSDRTPTAGQRFRLYADVHNIGSGTSATTRLQYWQRPPGGDWERVGDNDYVPALAPGRRVAYSTLLTAQPGTHEYTACVVRVRGEPAGSNCFRPYLTVTVGGSDSEYEITIDNARFDRSESFEYDGETLWQYWVEVTATNTGRRALVPDFTGDFTGNPAFLGVAFYDRSGNVLGEALGDVYMGLAPWSPGEQRRGVVWGTILGHERSRVHSYTLYAYDQDEVACIGCEARPLLAGDEERSTADRPDDLPGSQVHVMYVLPRDGRDDRLDVNGTIRTSMAAVQNWLAARVSRAFRIDTFRGQLDVTFFRLALTDEATARKGAFVRDQIESELAAAGRLSANKLYLVYYGGRSTFACGGAAWPPHLRGSVAALYLNGEPPGHPPCNTNSPGASSARMGYWEFGAAHELFHLLGAVPTCAPHHARRGHVDNDPRDLMYAGPEPWRPAFVDIGRDDYFGHRRACLDVQDTPFMRAARPSIAHAIEPSDRAWRPFRDTY